MNVIYVCFMSVWRHSGRLRQEYAETRKRYKKLIKSSGIFETDCPLVRDREKNDQDNRLKF